MAQQSQQVEMTKVTVRRHIAAKEKAAMRTIVRKLLIAVADNRKWQTKLAKLNRLNLEA